MNISIDIYNVQHINRLRFSLDLSQNKLTCIVGKNGAGKTTLIKAIKNLESADTFSKTSSRYIFNEHSRIEYLIGEDAVTYRYDSNLKVIDTRQIVPEVIKKNLFVELPIPYGMRFNNFPVLSKIDTELRKSIAFETYEEPRNLIDILNYVYQTDSYNNLKSFSFKDDSYYFRLNDNGVYIREDYFSSGEYFILNLYRMIESRRKIIVIDEIDISLDSSAQVNLVSVLRDFCSRHSINIVFTTHSLALMHTMKDDELYYMMSGGADGVTITNRSFNYIKSTLFGFKGWDKYILTEDETLQGFLEYIIDSSNNEYFYSYKIIYVGGGTNVVDLMRRNEREEFLTSNENVISVLDGDQAGFRHARGNNIFCIPFMSIEKDFYQAYLNDDSIPRVDTHGTQKLDKQVYNGLIAARGNGWDRRRIYEYLDGLKSELCDDFRRNIRSFLFQDI
ncbi:ATP-binding protein [Dickeya fangzhongdai]|uniref:AAA family ATPase n=1 Tax=Dickeya fangzhongdai TaxID=1778540 RepID=UPI0033075904